MTDPREQPESGARLDPEEGPHAADGQAHADAVAIRLGRFMPLGMGLGAAAGLVAGLLTHRFGICVPVGIALGILLAGTLPVFRHRR
jgi:hypothetical protein